MGILEDTWSASLSEATSAWPVPSGQLQDGAKKFAVFLLNSRAINRLVSRRHAVRLQDCTINGDELQDSIELCYWFDGIGELHL